MSSGVFFPRSLSREDESAFSSHGRFSEPEATRGSETVLLVEDEEDLRELVREILAAKGYRVLESCDGEEALAVAADHRGPIHVLLTDLELPHLGGRELAERLFALRPGLKVLFMTGYAEDDFDWQEDISPNFIFLQKPFHVLHLMRKVRELLDRG